MSRLKTNIISFVATLAFAVAFIGCDNMFKPPAETAGGKNQNLQDGNYIPLKEQVPVTSLESNLSKAVWHLVNAVEAAVETVEQYVEIPELENTRSAGGNAPNLESIGKYLPSDLSTLTRYRSVNPVTAGRSLTDSSDGETVTLQEELDSILADYDAEMRLLVPELDNSVLGDIALIEDGFLYLSDGTVIPQYSIEGIAVAEILAAIASGEDTEAAVLKVTDEIEKMLGVVTDDFSRGLYIKGVKRWEDGKVHYKYGTFRKSFKEATRLAMNEWEAASSKKVKFIEFSESSWDWFQVTVGAMHLLRIEEHDLGAGISGQAAPGSLAWGISYMRLNPKVVEDKKTPGIDSAYTVSLHELGHVLGLQHEHQKWDRDNFIEVKDNVSLNNIRILEVSIPVYNPIIEWRSTKVLCITIRYPVIVVKTEWHDQFLKTEFDMCSIMLYSGYPVKKAEHKNTSFAEYDSVTKKWKTKYNDVLSFLDKQFIKRLY